ncbi:hypothetical protein HMPREF9372_1640 [Sporosarcina newyorkensis 2681]|uniref:Uncharacterized protein n=1 Tax=Sporosarcina newyorkensis 2681 TaxID=1027292 RepID=F9DS60_9BACL|nr:hypothetical protein [Sporosarcina newyorkensis]EGQ26360.1 hypothetical protein HMPREF9372_1640 [Sporosarcina newyorkensis 2681]
MDTRSKNRSGVGLSLVAIALAVISLVYCASFAVDFFVNGWERLGAAVDYFGRIVRGGTIQ